MIGRSLRAAVCVAAAFVPACSSPLGGQDVDLAFTGHGLPGAGAGVELGQRVGALGGWRVDAELGLTHQELSDRGPSGDDFDQVWVGLRFAPHAGTEPGVLLRAGATWLRADGEASALDDPGDYGGIYAGARYLWPLSTALSTGPDLSLSAVDSEGAHSGSGLVVGLAWGLVWHL